MAVCSGAYPLPRPALAICVGTAEHRCIGMSGRACVERFVTCVRPRPCPTNAMSNERFRSDRTFLGPNRLGTGFRYRID